MIHRGVEGLEPSAVGYRKCFSGKHLCRHSIFIVWRLALVLHERDFYVSPCNALLSQPYSANAKVAPTLPPCFLSVYCVQHCLSRSEHVARGLLLPLSLHLHVTSLIYEAGSFWKCDRLLTDRPRDMILQKVATMWYVTRLLFCT